MTNLPQEGTSPDGMFGKPISEYSDEHALEDGVLIDLTQFTKLRFHRLPINRMTRHLFEAFGPELDNEEERKRFGYYLRWVFRVKFGFAQPSSRGRWRHLVAASKHLTCSERRGRLDRHVPGGLLTGRTEGGAIHPLFWCS